MISSAHPISRPATTGANVAVKSSPQPAAPKHRLAQAIIPTITIIAGLLSLVVLADFCRSWWLGLTHPPRYEVRVRIGSQNFDAFEHIILAGTDLLTHLPYSFNALSSSQKTSGWPLSELLTTYPSTTGRSEQVSSPARWPGATIPRHQHLFIKRHAVAGEGIYDWLRSISHHHQSPQQIDLILTQTESADASQPYLHQPTDPPLTPITTISLFSATPFAWSVKSNPSTTGHFDEYAHISYQSFAQSSTSPSPLINP